MAQYLSRVMHDAARNLDHRAFAQQILFREKRIFHNQPGGGKEAVVAERLAVAAVEQRTGFADAFGGDDTLPPPCTFICLGLDGDGCFDFVPDSLQQGGTGEDVGYQPEVGWDGVAQNTEHEDQLCVPCHFLA